MNHPAPLYLQIQQFLRLAIEQGRFRAGDKLPSEPELAERFGTTRATVARALQQLVFEGLIARRAGSGTITVVMPKANSDRLKARRLSLPSFIAPIWSCTSMLKTPRVARPDAGTGPVEYSVNLLRQTGPASSRIWLNTHSMKSLTISLSQAFVSPKPERAAASWTRAQLLPKVI